MILIIACHYSCHEFLKTVIGTKLMPDMYAVVVFRAGGKPGNVVRHLGGAALTGIVISILCHSSFGSACATFLNHHDEAFLILTLVQIEACVDAMSVKDHRNRPWGFIVSGGKTDTCDMIILTWVRVRYRLWRRRLLNKDNRILN